MHWLTNPWSNTYLDNLSWSYKSRTITNRIFVLQPTYNLYNYKHLVLLGFVLPTRIYGGSWEESIAQDYRSISETTKRREVLKGSPGISTSATGGVTRGCVRQTLNKALPQYFNQSESTNACTVHCTCSSLFSREHEYLKVLRTREGNLDITQHTGFDLEVTGSPKEREEWLQAKEARITSCCEATAHSLHLWNLGVFEVFGSRPIITDSGCKIAFPKTALLEILERWILYCECLWFFGFSLLPPRLRSK